MGKSDTFEGFIDLMHTLIRILHWQKVNHMIFTFVTAVKYWLHNAGAFASVYLFIYDL